MYFCKLYDYKIIFVEKTNHNNPAIFNTLIDTRFDRYAHYSFSHFKSCHLTFSYGHSKYIVEKFSSCYFDYKKINDLKMDVYIDNEEKYKKKYVDEIKKVVQETFKSVLIEKNFV